MSVERSVPTNEAVAELLKTHYGLHVTGISALPNTCTSCYRVETDAGCFFLKQQRASFKKTALDAESGVTAFLTAKGFPTAQILPTTDGESCASLEGRLFTLQPFLPGETYNLALPPTRPLPRTLLTDGAQWLGRLHTLLRDYPAALPAFLTEEQFDDIAAGKLISRFDGLIALAETRPGDPNSRQLLGEALYSEALALRMVRYLPAVRTLPCTPTHGDYLYCQWLCENDRIRAVIDFSSVCAAPRALDLLRSYLYAEVSDELNIEDCCAYVRAYLTEAALSEDELATAPYLLLTYLLIFIAQCNSKNCLNSSSDYDMRALRRYSVLNSLCRKLDRSADKLSAALQTCR